MAHVVVHVFFLSISLAKSKFWLIIFQGERDVTGSVMAISDAHHFRGFHGVMMDKHHNSLTFRWLMVVTGSVATISYVHHQNFPVLNSNQFLVFHTYGQYCWSKSNMDLCTRVYEGVKYFYKVGGKTLPANMYGKSKDFYVVPSRLLDALPWNGEIPCFLSGQICGHLEENLVNWLMKKDKGKIDIFLRT